MTTVPASEMRLAKRLADQALATPAPVLTNEQFAALSKPEQRVAIASDVLDWLRSKRLTPKASIYLRVFATPDCTLPINCNDINDINGYSCQACALGGVFALASFRTGISIGETARGALPFNEEMHKQLGDYFSREQLALIECAFEVSTGFDYSVISHEQALQAWKFGAAIENASRVPGVSSSTGGDRERDARKMRAIMQNIIDNGGTFIP